MDIKKARRQKKARKGLSGHLPRIEMIIPVE